MAAKWIKRLVALLVLTLIAAGLVYAFRPQPVAVDVATLGTGPMEVTIDEEGIARIRDIFRVSAPIPGRVERLPVDVGDTVEANRTIVAAIHPVDPPLLDVRTRRELEAAVEAAKAAVMLAQAQIDSAETNVRLMRSELERARELADRATISVRAFEKASADLETAEARVKEMHAALELRQSELDSAEARLIEPGSDAPTEETCCVTVLAPADGTVLNLLSESEQVVAAGGPLLEIGDPGNLEIIVHLLSSDAVAVDPEALARVDGWADRNSPPGSVVSTRRPIPRSPLSASRSSGSTRFSTSSIRARPGRGSATSSGSWSTCPSGGATTCCGCRSVHCSAAETPGTFSRSSTAGRR